MAHAHYHVLFLRKPVGSGHGFLGNDQVNGVAKVFGLLVVHGTDGGLLSLAVPEYVTQIPGWSNEGATCMST